MLEDTARHLADSFLCNACEHGISKFLGYSCADPSQTICTI